MPGSFSFSFLYLFNAHQSCTWIMNQAIPIDGLKSAARRKQLEGQRPWWRARRCTYTEDTDCSLKGLYIIIGTASFSKGRITPRLLLDQVLHRVSSE
ncbi:hypothetical protein BDR04DRAFT_851402 [Suillus decipiens]|nr:hypothetical protein BDR04DRAFT_851402 [Suillus decipiens]